jgi:hypothetical protein
MSHAWMLGIEQQQRVKLPATLAQQLRRCRIRSNVLRVYNSIGRVEL